MLGAAMMMASAIGVSTANTGVLDGLSVPAAAAYSLRQLSSTYSGPAISVRRSSDNTLANIGFSSGILDTAALLAFCGSGDGFIATWYDQSGNARNATQASTINQPKIVASGAVITRTGVPTLQFYNGAISSLSATINAFSAGFSVNAVVINTGTQTYTSIADKSSAGVAGPWALFGISNQWSRSYIGNGATQNYYAPTVPSNAYNVITHQCDGVTKAVDFFGNGTLNTSTSVSTTYGDTTNPVTIGRRGDSATYLQGNLSELVLFGAPLGTADRNLLERDQGTYYGITVA